MKVVILAGGQGTRLAEETVSRPKPMVEVGGKPLLWHILNIYAAHGLNEFVIALGYKGEMVKEYFLNYFAMNNDLSVDLKDGSVTVHEGIRPDWRVHLVDTGQDTMTGGRLRRLKPHLQGDTFLATYGDGVGDVDISRLMDFHKSHGRLATVTAVRPPSRFGEMQLKGDEVCVFSEKPQTAEGWINGGFFALEPGALDYIEGDSVPFEYAPLARMAEDGQLRAFKHEGFWQPMDTLRDKHMLEHLWSMGSAPWKVWK